MDESSEQGDCSALKGSRIQAAATCDAVDTEHIGAKRHRAAGSEPSKLSRMSAAMVDGDFAIVSQLCRPRGGRLVHRSQSQK